MNIVKTEIDDKTKENLWKKAFERFGYSKEAISLALKEAINKWLESDETDENEIEKERILNNLAYNKIKEELMEKYEGKYVAIAKGQLIGISDTYNGVLKLANEKAPNSNHRLIFKIKKEAKERKVGQLGWRMKVKRQCEIF